MVLLIKDQESRINRIESSMFYLSLKTRKKKEERREKPARQRIGNKDVNDKKVRWNKQQMTINWKVSKQAL